MRNGWMMSGFVLVGGQSRRMGQDKALLPWRGVPLARHVALNVADVAQTVALVGDPRKYGHLGMPVIADAEPDRGPLSGIEAALLSAYASEWNLIVACDMPRVPPEVFAQLAQSANQASSEIECVMPGSKCKLQPLCAVYRRRCGGLAQQALAGGTRRVTDWALSLRVHFWPIEDEVLFQNVNTPLDWAQLEE